MSLELEHQELANERLHLKRRQLNISTLESVLQREREDEMFSKSRIVSIEEKIARLEGQPA